jgi:WD40 repeat protein
MAGWSSELPKYVVVHDGPVAAVSFSQDGSLLATGGNDGIRLWDALAERPRGQPIVVDRAVSAAALSPDGKTLAVCYGVEVELWDTDSQQPRKKLSPRTPLTGRVPPRTLAFSRDGRRVAAGYGGDWSGFFCVWDPSTGDLQFSENHGDDLLAVTFNSDGTRLVSAGGGGVRIWDLVNRKKIAGERAVSSLRPGPSPPQMTTQAPSTDVDTLGASLLGEPSRQVHGVPGAPSTPSSSTPSSEPPGGNRETPPAIPGTAVSTALSADGKRLAIGYADGTVRFWNSVTLLPIGEALKHDAVVNAVTFGGDDSLLGVAADDGTVTLWNITTELPYVERKFSYERTVHAIAFSPSDGTVATAGGDGIVCVRSSRRGTLLKPDEGRSRIHNWKLAFDAGGGVLRSVFRSGTQEVQKVTVKSWDASGKVLSDSFEVDGFFRALSVDGRILGTSVDKSVQLWDVPAQKLRGKPLRHDTEILEATFSPQGDTLVVECLDDQRGGKRLHSVWLWDTVSGMRRGDLIRPEDFLEQILFSPGGDKVAMADRYGVVRIRDIRSGEDDLLGTRAWGLLFVNEGRNLITSGDTISMWDLSKGKPQLKGSRRSDKAPSGYSLRDQQNILRWFDTKAGRLRDKPFIDLNNEEFFSPDARLVLGKSDPFVSVRSAETGERLWEPIKVARSRMSQIKAMFNRDGKILVAADDNRIRLWDTVAGRLRGPALYAPFQFDQIELSPHGDRLAVAAGDQVQIWSVPEPTTARPEVLRLSIETRSGRTIDKGLLRELTPQEWSARVVRLDSLGGDCFRATEHKH